MKKLFSYVICVMMILFAGCEPNAPAISSKGFSVSDSKKVTFSLGNLQYHPANDEWRFAPSQLDYIGEANENISSTYNGWLDLFGWSTSSTNFGVSTSKELIDYLGDFVDWGRNKIDNSAPNTWRTLTNHEWDYLLNSRKNATSLSGIAQINGINGLIFFPDNWTCPNGITFKSGFHTEFGTEYYAVHQIFTAEQWSELEKSGGIFLPAAGARWGTILYDVQLFGCYWSANEYNNSNAYFFSLCSDQARMGNNYRDVARSVRLVKEL